MTRVEGVRPKIRSAAAAAVVAWALILVACAPEPPAAPPVPAVSDPLLEQFVTRASAATAKFAALHDRIDRIEAPRADPSTPNAQESAGARPPRFILGGLNTIEVLVEPGIDPEAWEVVRFTVASSGASFGGITLGDMFRRTLHRTAEGDHVTVEGLWSYVATGRDLRRADGTLWQIWSSMR